MCTETFFHLRCPSNFFFLLSLSMCYTIVFLLYFISVPSQKVEIDELGLFHDNLKLESYIEPRSPVEFVK